MSEKRDKQRCGQGTPRRLSGEKIPADGG
jgi:hypothetical protein